MKLFSYCLDNNKRMKRENEENFPDSADQLTMDQLATTTEQQGSFNEEDDHNSNDNNDTNNSNNSNQDNGPTNPPKRLRLNDDEEIRLLIPSKVCAFITTHKIIIHLNLLLKQ